MPVKHYEKRFPAQAIQFQNTDSAHINEIIAFVGVPISVDYTPAGVRLRVIRGAYDVLVAESGDFIVKDSTGSLCAMKQAEFEAEYEEVL